jgi:hypothetical protein
VRPSRWPLRGLLRMRNFRNAINGLPHAEERPQACPRLELGAHLEARTTSLLLPPGKRIDDQALRRPHALELGHCEARFARRSNPDPTSAQRPEIASLALATRQRRMRVVANALPSAGVGVLQRRLRRRGPMGQSTIDQSDANNDGSWSNAELRELGDLLVRGASIDEIARLFQRDIADIRDKLAEIGRACRPSPEQE